ncbi:uncharacterized protein LOC124813379 [Hydra vulgaris]|uniref:uncharacterized protein LOC124813379 n=1 Tax=Hydra vulgaris TaxID=6087 RepID=UPI001F5EEB62|nr:uncharacterized protein LOC124813379 [Hydra vulgaris]
MSNMSYEYYLSYLLKTKQTDKFCRAPYMEIAKDYNGFILSSINITNGVLIFISNVVLLVGLCKSQRKKGYSRNEKLVLLLSLVDFLVALVHIPLQVILSKNLNQIGCLIIAIIGFWIAFPLAFSGSIVVLISVERFIAIFNEKKCCGLYFKFNYLFLIIVLHFIISFGLGLWYTLLVYKQGTFLQKSVFFFCIATFIASNLISVLFINTYLLFAIKKKLRTKEIHVLQHHAVEKRLTHTMILISISLIVLYLPSVTVSYYVASILYLKKYDSVAYGLNVLFSTLTLCELNSAFNAVIYVVRSKRIRKVYLTYVSMVTEKFSKTVQEIQNSSTDTDSRFYQSSNETVVSNQL